MRNRTFTIKGVHIPCKRIPKEPLVIATIDGKPAKFTVYGKDVTLTEGEVPQPILEGRGGLIESIATWFSNNMEPAI